MSRNIIPLEHGKFYHIYNRGINSQSIFFNNENYLYFMQLYGKYIENIAETFAWCLMPNHFHFLVRIKDEDEINFIPRKILSENEPFLGQKAAKRVSETPTSVENHVGGSNDKRYKPSNQFSHLFNSYAQAINKQYNRHGSLFEKPFRRIWIDDEKHYKNIVLYIHNNSIHHGFVNNIIEYTHTSYHTFLSQKPTKLKREIVINWFNDIKNFKYLHSVYKNNDEVDRFSLE